MTERALAGTTRTLRRHLLHREGQTYDELTVHFLDGSHSWNPEDLDAAISELLFSERAHYIGDSLHLTSKGRAT